MRPLRFAVALLALVAGCQPATRPEPTRVAASPYYPLQVGTTWVYRGPDHERVMRVARDEMVNGVPCALVESLRDGTVIEANDVCAKPDGVYILAANGDKLSAPLRILKLPPRNGATWRVNFHKDGKRSQGVYVMGEDDVEVPAGKYHAVTLQGEIREGTRSTLTFTYWFARGVGIVKQVLREGDRKTVYELESFEQK
jgi:hypothetical protein